MKHLKDNNQSYLSHLKFAASIGFGLTYRALIFLVHGLVPCISIPENLNLNKTSQWLDLSSREIENRKKDGPPKYPEHQTPWQEIYRNHVGHMSGGGVLENAVTYQKVKNSLPRDNH